MSEGADRSTVAGVLGAWDEAAEDFGRLAEHLWGPVGAGTVAVTRPTEGERVLDACCGTGASAEPAARAVGARGLVDAVDLSESMVAMAARSAAGLPQLRTHAADVTSWQPDGYDVVQCVLGAFFFPDMDAGTEWLVRRARPGGRVAVTIWERGALVPAGEALVGAVGAVRGQPMETPRASTRVQELGDRVALGSWLADRGLADVDVTTVPLVLPMDPHVLWLLVLGSGFRGMLTGLDDEQVGAVRAGYLERLADGAPVDATTLVALGRRP
ncbi:class I SAM-dependent methyltransferase [Blastococcus haudaquaticus]|uniref:Methyltransferase domain-containing protein n=1 Tax=Blastococcus haudaquaticus TaxID=1938745 RepID=A0A286H4H0_9ACTN|nr:methyltransferase domain-containing protein [Blastococcus haudaquaticus]SOE02229.1 Methyltransferase domain-containing protein [Blastococcus haudaquaticus]